MFLIKKIFIAATFSAALLTAPAHAFWGLLGKAAGTASKGAGAAASGAAKVGSAAKVGGAAMIGSEATEALTLLKTVGGKSSTFADDAMALGTKSGLSIEEISKASGLKLGVPDEVAFYLKQAPSQLNEAQTSRMFQLYLDSKNTFASMPTDIANTVSKIPPHEAFRLLHAASHAGNRQALQHYSEACRIQRLNWAHEPTQKHKPLRDRLHELEKIDAQCIL